MTSNTVLNTITLSIFMMIIGLALLGLQLTGGNQTCTQSTDTCAFYMK